MKTHLKNNFSSKIFFAAAGLSVGVAGTAFAAETVSAHRQSSGSQTNPGVTTYVGNAVWGADSYEYGQKFFAEEAQKAGLSFTWDESKKAYVYSREMDTFEDEYGNTLRETDTEYLSFDTVFALSGSAVFENAGTANFYYKGDRADEVESGKKTDSAIYRDCFTNELLVAFSDSSKFVNTGTLSFVSETTASYTYSPDGTKWTWGSGQAPQFEVYFVDNSQLVNEASGTISGGDKNGTTTNIYFLDNAKFYNKGMLSDVFFVQAEDSAYIENSGTLICCVGLGDNAQVVNTVAGTMDCGEICFYLDCSGRSTFKNYGTVSADEISFDFLDLPSGAVAGTFENHGTLNFKGYGWDDNDVEMYFEAYQQQTFAQFESVSKDLTIRNYGTINAGSSGTVRVVSYVDVSLAEGSRLNGKLSLGNGFEYSEYVGDDWDDDEIEEVKTAARDRSVLTVLLTGKGGDGALVSDGIELNNVVELKFSFEDGVQKKKYVVNLWDGDLTGDGRFDTTFASGNYEMFLSVADGTLTIKDTSVGEEYVVGAGDADASYDLGRNDLAEFGEDLSVFRGVISGGGEVDADYDVTFDGDARGHSGKTVVGGTFTVTEAAHVSAGDYEVAGTIEIQGGTKKFGGSVTGSGTVNVQAGQVSFGGNVGVKMLNVSADAVLDGGAVVTNPQAKVFLDGKLALNADAQEKVSLASGAVLTLGKNASLEISGNRASARGSLGTSARLRDGERVVVIEGGTLVAEKDGGLKEFLLGDASISGLAESSAVVMYTDGGLSVQVIRDARALSSRISLPDDVREAAEVVLSEVTLDLSPGLKTLDELSGTASGDPLATAVLTDPEKAGEMIMNILPVHYAAMVAMTAEAFYSDAGSISERLNQRRYDRYSASEPYEFYFQIQGNSADNDNDFNSPTFDFSTVGFLAGMDRKLNASTMLGLSVGADFGEAKIHNGGGKLEMSDMRFTGYFGKTLADQFYVNAGLQVGSGSFDIRRETVWGDPRGDAATWNVGGFAEAGALLVLTDSVFAKPYVSAGYIYAYVDDFDEKGRGAIWSVDSFGGDSLRTRVGCEISWTFTTADLVVWRLGLDVAYSHDFLGEEVDVKVKGDFPKMTAKALPADLFSVGPSLNVRLSERVGLYAGYAFSAGTDTPARHNGNVGVRIGL